MNKNESKYFYTARLMNQALLALLEKKDIDFISITEITQKAGVNRSTFYSNYIDIYDLAEKVKYQMAQEFAEFQLSNNSKHNPDGYLTMFKYIKDNQIFFKTYFKFFWYRTLFFFSI